MSASARREKVGGLDRRGQGSDRMSEGRRVRMRTRRASWSRMREAGSAQMEEKEEEEKEEEEKKERGGFEWPHRGEIFPTIPKSMKAILPSRRT
eukprot:766349-Hanusia_phi.AAC.2